MAYRNIYYLTILAVILAACDIKKSDITPEAAFVRVYESTKLNDEYYPEDIIQLEDNSFLILASLLDTNMLNFPKVSIISLASDGSVRSQIALPNSYSNPVPGWLEIDGKIYFVCMDDNLLEARLIEVTLNGDEVSYTNIKGFDKHRPLYSWTDGEELIILSYNELSDGSLVVGYDNNFNELWSPVLNPNGDFRGIIHDHFEKESTIPFQIGKIENTDGHCDYFVNCLTSYNLSMVFLNGASGTQSGIIIPDEVETGFSSTLHLGTDTFAISRFHSGNSHLFPKVNINRNAISTTSNYEGIPVTQLQPNAQMEILEYEHKGTDYIVFASPTDHHEIVLLFFNSLTGEQEYHYNLGFESDIKEVTKVIKTKDGGLAVLARTERDAKYSRILLYKITPDQLQIKE